MKFAISSEEEFADEIKSLGFEDSGEDVSVGCFTEKQKFRMKPTEEFETEDLVIFFVLLIGYFVKIGLKHFHELSRTIKPGFSFMFSQSFDIFLIFKS